MYRSRLGKNLGKVTLDYVSSLNDDVEIAHHDILGSQAHTIMLYENKIITKKEVKKILKGLEDLKKEIIEAYNDLAEKVGTTPFVAVRSSATAEDLPGKWTNWWGGGVNTAKWGQATPGTENITKRSLNWWNFTNESTTTSTTPTTSITSTTSTTS